MGEDVATVLRKTVWTSNPDSNGPRFELEPPGFAAFYKVALYTLVVGSGVVLPLGLTGIFGAFLFDDFGVALRIAMGVAGIGISAVLLWLAVRILVGATSLRSRVTVTPAGVLVETGVSSARTRLWLAPVDAVYVDKPKVDSLERRGVVLTGPGGSSHIAIGYRERDADALLKALRDALEETTEDSECARPAGKPLGPSWPARMRRLAVDIVTPLRHPTPYLLVDLGAIVGTSALTWILGEVVDWRDAYPIAFGLFIVGLAARWYDGTYIAGLREYLQYRDGWSVRYMLAAIAIAIVGAGGMTSRLTLGPALGIAMLSSIGLHWAMLRRARSDATIKPNRKLDLALALSLVPLSILHEVAMFDFVVGSTKNLAVMSLALVPVTVLFMYAPIRMHAFVDDPGDRSNVAWFWLTAIWLGLGPVITVTAAVVREF